MLSKKSDFLIIDDAVAVVDVVLFGYFLLLYFEFMALAGKAF